MLLPPALPVCAIIEWNGDIMDVSAYINSPIHPSFARMVVVIVESNNKITVKRLFISNALTIHNDASEFITCGLVGVANSCLLRLAWVC